MTNRRAPKPDRSTFTDLRRIVRGLERAAAKHDALVAERDAEVLRLLRDGYTYRAIADAAGVAPQRVAQIAQAARTSS